MVSGINSLSESGFHRNLIACADLVQHWLASKRYLFMLFLVTVIVAPAAFCNSLTNQRTDSTVAALDFVWSGAVTNTSASVIAKIKNTSSNVICVVSENTDLLNPVYSSTANSTDANLMVRFDGISGLKENTQYYYGIRVDGSFETALNDVDNEAGFYTGKFKTFPAAGTATSFTFTSGTGHHGSIDASTHEIYKSTKNENPLFHVLTGDFYYCDKNQNEDASTKNYNLTEDNVRANYAWPLTSDNQSNLYRSTPVVYVWDDHDFGRNNKVGSESPIAMSNVHNVYRQLVPHYTLKGSGNTPIFQTWTVGRVRFILTDLFTSASTNAAIDDAFKTRMGVNQKEWFKEELLKANGVYPAIVWISSTPWIGTNKPGYSSWQAYTTERAELANFIKDNNIQGVTLISGDMHGSAIDDGTNSDYANGGGAPIEVFQTGSYGRSTSYKGGPYSHGATDDFPPIQYIYGLIEITDDGSDLSTSWSAKNTTGVQVAETDDEGDGLIQYSFTHSNPVVTSLAPADESTDVPIEGNLVMTFSKNIRAGTGNIYIKLVTDNSTIATISIRDSFVSTNQLTIPYSELSGGIAYYVEIAKTVVEDLSKNTFAGIYNPVGISYKKWNFTTTTYTAPLSRPQLINFNSQ